MACCKIISGTQLGSVAYPQYTLSEVYGKQTLPMVTTSYVKPSTHRPYVRRHRLVKYQLHHSDSSRPNVKEA